MKNIFFILLVSLLAFSCSNSTVFEHQHHFENKNWVRFDDINYELEVETGQKYNFRGTITVDSSYKSRKMELGFYLYLPDGGKRLEDKTIRILDYEYQHLGTKTEHGYEIPVELKKELSINEGGKLKIKITNHSQHLDNFGIISLDLIAKKK